MVRDISYADKDAAMAEAKRLEATNGNKPRYVVKCFDGTWVVTRSLPFGGEWYTTDGIRHG